MTQFERLGLPVWSPIAFGVLVTAMLFYGFYIEPSIMWPIVELWAIFRCGQDYQIAMKRQAGKTEVGS